ncbi:MAG: molybdate transport system substrate-binding protein [Clostridiales bacterium]|nr:molybdate transport system substrate-binding protein [Clostridiales bacterium]
MKLDKKRNTRWISILLVVILLLSACQTMPQSKSTKEAITGFEDVNTDQVSLIALGNSDVPVGQYSQEIFENMGIWEAIKDKISYGSNVKEVLSQVEEKSVDCGVVYATDAATATGVQVVASAPEGTLQTPVQYPVAMLSGSKSKEAAKTFLNFLLTKEAVAVFEAVGFQMAMEQETMNIEGKERATLHVFAAASLTESLTKIQSLFQEKYPQIEVILNFDSSGTLQTQIEEGADADIFFSAADKQMRALKEEGYIESDTIWELLNNEVVLIVPEA